MHRLVADHFLEKKYGDTQVNHLNYIKTDNRAENLEWCTPKENRDHFHKMSVTLQILLSDEEQ